MANNFTKTSPYIYILLVIMILPFTNLGIRYLHYIYIGLTVFLLLPQIRKSFKRKTNLLVWGFIFFIVFLSVFTPLITTIDLRTTEATLVYIFPPLFWILFFTKYPNFNFNRFLKFSVYVAFVVSILGFIQFFYSKTIFGLIPNISYYELDFTSDRFVTSGSIFRVRSILPSSQIYGLYTALSFCLSTYIFKKKNLLYFTVSLPILIASMLSGQRIVILVYLIYFVITILAKSKNILKSLVELLFFILVILFTLDIVNDILIKSGMATTRLLDIFTDFSSVVDYEQRARWTSWFELIKNTNPILGNGIGYTFNLEDGSRAVTSESYIIQLYFEGGLFLLCLFLILIYNSFKYSIVNKYKDLNWPILIALFASLIVVHSFNNPIFFVYWGIIIYPLTLRKNQHLNEKTFSGVR